MIAERHERFLIAAPSAGAMLAGASAAVVGIIIVVSLELAPEALTGLPSIVIALVAFLLITFLKVDVAAVAVGALATGILYAAVRS